MLDENEFEEIEEDVVLDELVSDHGAGAVFVTDCYDKVKIEHSPIEDVWFDEAETRHRTPRSLYRVPKGGLDKFVACEEFASDDPEKQPAGAVGTPETRRAAILAAANRPEAWRRTTGIGDTKSRVDIFEAWHLPSGPVEEEEYEEDEEYDSDDGERMVRTVKKTRPKHDGRHVVAVDGPDGTLIDEPWDGKGGFPVLLSVPRRRRRTIWGLSLMRDLIAPQREYEKLSKKIQHAHQKMGVSLFTAPKTANVNVRELVAGSFAAGALLEYEGQQGVTQLTPEPVAASTYAYRDGIGREMGEVKGISTLATASQVPAGLQQASGKALQVFEDFEDVRLLPYHRERERFRVRLAWLVVHAARRIVERKGSLRDDLPRQARHREGRLERTARRREGLRYQGLPGLGALEAASREVRAAHGATQLGRHRCAAVPTALRASRSGGREPARHGGLRHHREGARHNGHQGRVRHADADR